MSNPPCPVCQHPTTVPLLHLVAVHGLEHDRAVEQLSHYRQYRGKYAKLGPSNTKGE